MITVEECVCYPALVLNGDVHDDVLKSAFYLKYPFRIEAGQFQMRVGVGGQDEVILAADDRAQVKYTFTDRDNTAYPVGFAQALEEQIMMLESVTITDEEIDFMRRKCRYIPAWFYTYLKGYRFNHEWVKVHQDEDGHLYVDIEGCWSNTILLEVKLLAIISELYYTMTGEDSRFDYQAYYDKSYEKGRRLLEAGCVFSDFGTRRRASFEAEDVAVRAMKACSHDNNWPGKFVGTSNVYLAMKHDLLPVGTMAHEFVCAIGGMYGPQMANHIAMNSWRNTFRGTLGTYLYDSFGWDIFSMNFSEDFANLFKGLRIDSGDNYEQLMKIVGKYRSLGIDSKTKQVVFSNALDVSSAIQIQQYAKNYCLPSFGIGTHFTNEFVGVKPLNIVIKLIAAKITESWAFYNDTCKISEDKGKHTGNPEVVKRFMEALHIK